MQDPTPSPEFPTKAHPFVGKTWREIVTTLSWPEVREAVLDRDPLQIVNIPWWFQQYHDLVGSLDDSERRAANPSIDSP